MGEPNYVYHITEYENNDEENNNDDLVSLFGTKGSNLIEIAKEGVPVPKGILISAKACKEVFQSETPALPDKIWNQVTKAIKKIEEDLGKKVGDSEHPLLFSIRCSSSSIISGLLDSILNIGINDQVVTVLSTSANPKFAWDIYLRFLISYSDNILHIPAETISEKVKEFLTSKNVDNLSQLKEDQIQELIPILKSIEGISIPENPLDQLKSVIDAAYLSWNNEKAKEFRHNSNISDEPSLSIIIQTMAFGNLDEQSCSGSVYTRNPSTGDSTLWGDYIPQAQGTDYNGKPGEGKKNTQPIGSLESFAPDAFAQLTEACTKLEQKFHDMQTIDYTIEAGELYVLQCRTGKRTPEAELKIAIDQVSAGIISKESALLRIKPEQIETVLRPSFVPDALRAAGNRRFLNGINASPGAASGHICFSSETLIQKAEDSKESYILIAQNPTSKDFSALMAAKGIIIIDGNMESQAIIFARQRGIPAIICPDLKLDLENKIATFGQSIAKEDDILSIDGNTGIAYSTQLPLLDPQIDDLGDLSQILSWADEIRNSDNQRISVNEGPTHGLYIRANCDTVDLINKSKDYGASGIGLVKTENVILQSSNLLDQIRKALLFKPEPVVEEKKEATEEKPSDENSGSNDNEQSEENSGSNEEEDNTPKEPKKTPLEIFQESLTQQYTDILDAAAGQTIGIQLITSPLSVFFPNQIDLTEQLSELKERKELLGAEKEFKDQEKLDLFQQILENGKELSNEIKQNILKTQFKAILKAGLDSNDNGNQPSLEIILPYVSGRNEIKSIKNVFNEVKKEINNEKEIKFTIEIGLMLNTPQSIIAAPDWAKEVDFMLFGSNEITKNSFGMSKEDDENGFLAYYLNSGLLNESPFIVLDEEIGKLMGDAIAKMRKAKPEMSFGLCGKHAGNAKSIDICHNVGMNYVSCEYENLIIARVAGAQSVIKDTKQASK